MRGIVIELVGEPFKLYLFRPATGCIFEIVGYSPSGRIRLAALEPHLGRQWRRQGGGRQPWTVDGAVGLWILGPAERHRGGRSPGTGRVRRGWRRIGGVVPAHPIGRRVVLHQVGRRLLRIAVAAVHRRR